MQIARVAGGLGTIVQGAKNYLNAREGGASPGRAAIYSSLGFDIESGANNSLEAVAGRALETWWPSITGELAHQVIGNPKGAFDSGYGMKLNRHTPKGMNL